MAALFIFYHETHCVNEFRISDGYFFFQTLKMARSLSPRRSQSTYVNFLSLPEFLSCVLEDEALLVFKVDCNPCARTELSESSSEVDASEWMRLQYSDAVREDFLVHGEYIGFEQSWINTVHSGAVSGSETLIPIVFLAT